MQIFNSQRELSIPLECIFVHFIHVLEKVFKFLKKFNKQRLLQTMLQLLQKLLHTLGFNSVCSQLIIDVLSVLTYSSHRHSHIVKSSFTRNNELEVVGMPQCYSIEMVKNCLLANHRTIDKYFSFWIGLDKDSAFLIKNSAMPSHNTQNIELNMIFFSFFGTYLGLPFLNIIEQHSKQSRIFGHIHNIGKLSFIDISGLLW